MQGNGITAGRSYYQRVAPDAPYLRQRFVIYSEVTMGLTGDAYDASKVQVRRIVPSRCSSLASRAI